MISFAPRLHPYYGNFNKILHTYIMVTCFKLLNSNPALASSLPRPNLYSHMEDSASAGFWVQAFRVLLWGEVSNLVLSGFIGISGIEVIENPAIFAQPTCGSLLDFMD